MQFSTSFAYLPLLAAVLGGLAGLAATYYLPIRRALMLMGLGCIVALILIVWLASVQPGNEPAAFAPFVVLTGAVFPALFAAIMGGAGGRALRKRNGQG